MDRLFLLYGTEHRSHISQAHCLGSSLVYPHLNKTYCCPVLLKAEIFFLKSLRLIKMTSRFETTDNEKSHDTKYLKLDFCFIPACTSENSWKYLLQYVIFKWCSMSFPPLLSQLCKGKWNHIITISSSRWSPLRY